MIIKKMQLVFLYAGLLFLGNVFYPFKAHALQFAQPQNVIVNIPALISWAIQILFVVAGLVAFVYLLLGGIKWITSGGDKGQVEAARNQIIQALIGLVIVFAAWGMIVLVEQLLNVGLGFSKSLELPGTGDLKTVPGVGIDPTCAPGKPC